MLPLQKNGPSHIWGKCQPSRACAGPTSPLCRPPNGFLMWSQPTSSFWRCCCPTTNTVVPMFMEELRTIALRMWHTVVHRPTPVAARWHYDNPPDFQRWHHCQTSESPNATLCRAKLRGVWLGTSGQTHSGVRTLLPPQFFQILLSSAYHKEREFASLQAILHI